MTASHRSPPRQQNELIQRHQGLVRKEAYRCAQIASQEPLDDLLQVGNIGLVKAIASYSPGKGTFAGYAQAKIRGELQHYLRDKCWGAVKPPRRWVEQVARVRNAKLPQESETQAAARFGIGEGTWSEMLQARRRQAALPEGLEVVSPTPDPEWERVNQAVDRLREPQKTCVIEYYYHRVGVRSLAGRFGVRQSQVKAWLASSLLELREGLESLG